MPEKKPSAEPFDLKRLQRAAANAAKTLNARGAELLKGKAGASRKTPKGAGPGWAAKK